MVQIKRFAMAGGAMVTAAAIGFVMQSGTAPQGQVAQAAMVPDISGTASDPLEVTDIKLTSAVADTSGPSTGSAPLTDAPIADAVNAPETRETATTQVAALGDAALPQSGQEQPAPASLCEVSMEATPVAAAMVDVTLNAPCFPGERVTLHHNGMMFTDVTDENGVLAVSVPALTKNAIFIAAFANGEGALASAGVDGLEFYDRKVVQSKASGHLHINAFEFGADYRGEGHVNADASRTFEHAAKGDGGFVTRLGDAQIGDALVAEIYTFPTATSKTKGDVRVSVEAEVTSDNCGIRIEAQTLEVSAGGRLKVQDLTLPIPACDAVGDFLVLQNLLGDLTVARN